MALGERKYLSLHGVQTLIKEIIFGKKKIWHGSREAWNELSAAEKAKYEQAEIIDGENTGLIQVVDKIEEGNLNPVTSNAVGKTATVSITPVVGSAQTFVATRVGNQVLLRVDLKGLTTGQISNDANTPSVLGTVPEGFRPVSITRTTALVYANDSATRLVVVNVMPNGTVAAWSDGQPAYIWCTLIYPTTEAFAE